MKNAFMLRQLLLLAALLTLSGCLLVPVDDGFHRGDSRGGHHKDHRNAPEGYR
jgi:hypothetical protein